MKLAGIIARWPDVQVNTCTTINHIFLIKTTCWWGWGSNGGCMVIPHEKRGLITKWHKKEG